VRHYLILGSAALTLDFPKRRDHSLHHNDNKGLVALPEFS
jgi:hypothetical protein